MTREEIILREVAAHNPHLTFEDLMGVSDEMPSEVCRLIADSTDRAAALECWRSMMHSAVDEVANRYKAGEQV
jgi:hypothetical protein